MLKEGHHDSHADNFLQVEDDVIERSKAPFTSFFSALVKPERLHSPLQCSS